MLLPGYPGPETADRLLRLRRPVHGPARDRLDLRSLRLPGDALTEGRMEPNPWQRFLLGRLNDNPDQQDELKRIMGLKVTECCRAVLKSHPAGRGPSTAKRICGFRARRNGYCYRHQHHARTS